MKSLRQLELECSIRYKSPSYWARTVKPSCENCWKDYECELLQELEKINEEIAELEQKWDTLTAHKHVDLDLAIFANGNDDKAIEKQKAYAREKWERKAIRLFENKSEIEYKITSCLNRRTYLAIKLYHNNFLNQGLWGIANCKHCPHYLHVEGLCPILGIYNPSPKRICQHYDGMDWSELRKIIRR